MSIALQKSTIMYLMNQLVKIRDVISSASIENVFELECEVHQAILDITKMIFPDNHISTIYRWKPAGDSKEEFLIEFAKWYDFMYEIIQKLDGVKNITEEKFYLLMCYLKAAEQEEIQALMKKNLGSLKYAEKDVYEGLITYYSMFKSYWGDLNPENGVFECIVQRACALKEHIEDWEWLYENLCDIRSKKVLYNILMNWLTFDIEWIDTSIEKVYVDYFDLDLIPETSKEEVFVDLGGYVGDTLEEFVTHYTGRYKRVYTYEINEQNYYSLVEKSKEYHDIIPRKVGVGAKAGRMFLNMEIGDSCTSITEKGEQEIEVVALDEDIKEKITWIKMDIEGSEQDALRGCRKHIENEKPKLTICTYHNNEDIWKIPRMVKEYREDYKLYLRYNGHTAWPAEYVLFAL